jgi:hypothetical protein
MKEVMGRPLKFLNEWGDLGRLSSNLMALLRFIYRTHNSFVINELYALPKNSTLRLKVLGLYVVDSKGLRFILKKMCEYGMISM